MPKIRLKRGTNLATSTHELSAGEPAFDTETGKLYIAKEDNDDVKGSDAVRVKYADQSDQATQSTDSSYAEKIGTSQSQSQVGSNTKHVYLSSAGVITQSDGDVGSSTKPVYMSGGDITESDATVGDDHTPIYMDNGEFKELSMPDDSDANRPVYFDKTNGFSTGNRYAGGTRVTLNNSPKNSSGATFYAPELSGNAGQFLVSAGVGSSPEWKDSPVPVSTNKVTTPSDEITISNIEGTGGVFVVDVILQPSSGSGEYRVSFVLPAVNSTGYACQSSQVVMYLNNYTLVSNESIEVSRTGDKTYKFKAYGSITPHNRSIVSIRQISKF